MIIYTKGDITTAKKGIILHGCNLQNAFGSGVAGAIASKWPECKKTYHNAFNVVHSTDRQPVLGQIVWHRVDDNLVVANGFTQKYFGSDGNVYADKLAIKVVLLSCVTIAYFDEDLGGILNIPKIGCGLGGLSWEQDVLPLVEEVNEAFPEVMIIVWEL